jgi:hypothetical protein
MASTTDRTPLALLPAGLALALGAALLLPHAPTQAHAAVVIEPACEPVDRMPLEGRPSPFDSTQVALADGMVKVCYGSPALRGRVMIGGEAVPYGQPWRFGANEPTTLHTSVPLSVGGVSVPAGSVTLYAIPAEGHWEIVVNSSVDRWGIPINADVRAHDVGSFHVEPSVLAEAVESLVFRFEDAGSRSATLVMEWQNTRVEIPVTATGDQAP